MTDRKCLDQKRGVMLNVLFVHQNFPGQFKHLAPAIAALGHRVKAMAIDGPGLPGIELHRYRPSRSTSCAGMCAARSPMA